VLLKRSGILTRMMNELYGSDRENE
jgi:hypothetical protein